MRRTDEVHKIICLPQLAAEFFSFITETEATNANVIYFHKNIPHPLPSHVKMVALAKNIILDFNFLFWGARQGINFRSRLEEVKGISKQASWLGIASKNTIIENKAKIWRQILECTEFFKVFFI